MEIVIGHFIFHSNSDFFDLYNHYTINKRKNRELDNMKEIDKSYLIKKINKLNKKIHRSESQENDNKTWWRKMKLKKLTKKLKHL